MIVGVTGASGAPLALALLKELHSHEDIETHLCITRNGILTIREECGMKADEFASFAEKYYDNDEIGAAIASGTFDSMGMVIIPCSMKTVAGIAQGYSDNLLLRAADVTVKERHRLVIVARETPLSKIHLDNMAYLAGIPGVSILPPVVSYYHHPKSLEEMEHQIVCRVMNCFGIETDMLRWK